MKRNQIYPIIFALGAAVLAGISAPLAKLLLGGVEPLFLAAFLYLGCGNGVLLFRLTRRLLRTSEAAEAHLTRSDYPWLAGAALSGGVAAPILMLFSLQATPAATASLLLNFESVATTLIAWRVFREAVGRNAWWALAAITAASILLSLEPGAEWGFSMGALGILMASVLWGVDNNFTRNIAAKDPLDIVMVKGLAAGSVSLVIAVLAGSRFPEAMIVLLALLLGGVCYGLGIVLYVLAQRGLGAARTGALFSASPLAGVALSFILFREPLTVMLFIAFPLILIGTILLVIEQHRHPHTHVPTHHDHAHTHEDPHHNHCHDGLESVSHAHPHEHDHQAHDHPHMPDTHHRHTHK